ncbi:MAG TPA: hypothetical protein VK807_15115, partial [Gemmatimonadaceae bacterium]|nr:hypothetical protein [Gemmatimonadaceae bacterium]
RVVLLSAPQAFFGLALDGWVLAAIIVSLTVTSWATAIQRIVAVYHATTNAAPSALADRTRTPASSSITAADSSAEPPKAAKAVNV